MLYPKVKKKKFSIKSYIRDVLDDIRIIIFKIIKMMMSLDYFILFMKKSFHF